MKKSLLAILLIYLSAFLFFKEEVHSFSHHLNEVDHHHSIKCFFEGGEEKSGIKDICHFHDLFIHDSVSEISFFILLTPKLIDVSYFFPKNLRIFQNFIFFLPESRAPPKIS